MRRLHWTDDAVGPGMQRASYLSRVYKWSREYWREEGSDIEGGSISTWEWSKNFDWCRWCWFSIYNPAHLNAHTMEFLLVDDGGRRKRRWCWRIWSISIKRISVGRWCWVGGCPADSLNPARIVAGVPYPLVCPVSCPASCNVPRSADPKRLIFFGQWSLL